MRDKFNLKRRVNYRSRVMCSLKVFLALAATFFCLVETQKWERDGWTFMDGGMNGKREKRKKDGRMDIGSFAEMRSVVPLF